MVGSGPSRAAHIVAAITSFAAIATVIVSLRLFTRARLIRHVGKEDWLILVSLLFSWALTALIYEQIRFGLGRHINTLPEADITASLKPFFYSILAYNFSLTLSKLSILYLYLSFFVSRRDRIACFTVIALIISYSIYLFISQIFICHPVQYFWNKTITTGRCINEDIIWFLNAALNIVSDFIIICLPIPSIYNLSLPSRQKAGLLLIFMIGFFTCITSIIRLKTLKEVANSKDTTWENTAAATWSSIEVNMAIICACLPTLKPLVSRIFPRLLATSLQSSGGRGISHSGSRIPQFSAKASHQLSRLDAAHLRGREEDELGLAMDKYSLAASINTTAAPERWSDDNSGMEKGGGHPKTGRITVTTLLDQSFADQDETEIVSQQAEPKHRL